MIHYMKRAYFTRVFDNIGFKCKIICHLKISADGGFTILVIVVTFYPRALVNQTATNP